MVDEPLCVCDHPVASHTVVKRKSDGTFLGMFHCSANGCLCWKARPVLSWPDGKGWWWCNYFQSGLTIEAVEVNDYKGCLWFYSQLYEKDTSKTDHHWKNPDGPPRFARCEPNPFEQISRSC